jgi:hypothetical protein
MRQFMRLTRREGGGDRASRAVGDHAGLCAIAAMRPTKRLTRAPTRRSGLFTAAPAVF